MFKRFILMGPLIGMVFFAQSGINFWSSESTLQLSNVSNLRILTPSFPVTRGSLIKAEYANIVGNPVEFNSGTYVSGDLSLLLTALYDFGAPYPIVLDGGRFFRANSGVIADKIFVQNDNNRLEGQPMWQSDFGVTLQDFRATLTVFTQNALNSSVLLNNGTLLLEGDLRLGDEVVLTSSGQVRCFGHKVSLGTKPMTWPSGSIVWRDSPIVELNNNVTLAGTWTFSGVSKLVGNGCVLDFSSGTIRVDGNGPLYITNVKLKGLGSGVFQFVQPRAQIRLSNVEIEMNDDVTLSSGGLYVEGQSTLVSKGNILTFDYGSSLSVDGVVFNYETLSVLDSNNIQPTRDVDPNNTRVALLNSGLIRRVKGVQVGPLVLNPSTPFQTIRISENLELAPTKELIIANDLVFNGSTNAIVFTKSQKPLIDVQPGKTLKFENVVLRNFSFDYLHMGANSKIIFDDKTRIELVDSMDLNGSYTFRGETVINGQNNFLNFTRLGGIELHSSIAFEDITLYGLSGTQLHGWDDSSTVSFQRVTLYLDTDFTFTKGHFEVLDWFDVVGSGTFHYQTNQSSIIWPYATMTMGNYATFYYDPIVANRDLIVFVDDRSIFALDGGMLVSSTTGMRLLGGTFQVSNDSFLLSKSNAALSESIQFGDGVDEYNDCIVNLISSANMYVDSGLLNYNNVLLE